MARFADTHVWIEGCSAASLWFDTITWLGFKGVTHPGFYLNTGSSPLKTSANQGYDRVRFRTCANKYSKSTGNTGMFNAIYCVVVTLGCHEAPIRLGSSN